MTAQKMLEIMQQYGKEIGVDPRDFDSLHIAEVSRRPRTAGLTGWN